MRSFSVRVGAPHTTMASGFYGPSLNSLPILRVFAAKTIHNPSPKVSAPRFTQVKSDMKMSWTPDAMLRFL